MRDLPRPMKAELKGLPKDLAEIVGAYLVAAGSLLDEDPMLAYQHAEAARRRAARLPVAREATAETAYAAGLFDVARNEFRALRRMTGSSDFIPVLADCERALGSPQKALALVAEGEESISDPAMLVELTLVKAGARDDMGQPAEALRLLSTEIEKPRGQVPKPAQARLRYAYGMLLLAAGQEETAREWFVAAARIDPEGTDALDRLDELDGIVLTASVEDLTDEDGLIDPDDAEPSDGDQTSDDSGEVEESTEADLAGDAEPGEPGASEVGDRETENRTAPSDGEALGGRDDAAEETLTAGRDLDPAATDSFAEPSAADIEAELDELLAETAGDADESTKVDSEPAAASVPPVTTASRTRAKKSPAAAEVAETAETRDAAGVPDTDDHGTVSAPDISSEPKKRARAKAKPAEEATVPEVAEPKTRARAKAKPAVEAAGSEVAEPKTRARAKAKPAVEAAGPEVAEPKTRARAKAKPAEEAAGPEVAEPKTRARAKAKPAEEAAGPEVAEPKTRAKAKAKEKAKATGEAATGDESGM